MLFKTTSLLIPLLLTIFIYQYASAQQICQALALQGGPNQGAYQAGAISGLIAHLPPEKVRYDIVTGISIGAVNAAFFSQFEKGQERFAATYLLNLWLSIRSWFVYSNWPGGVLQGLIFEAGLYNTQIGKEYFSTHIGTNPQRLISIGATNIKTGMFTSFNNFDKPIDPKVYIEAIMASLAVPGLFPHKVINDVPYFDGSVVKSLDLMNAITQCRKITGGDDSKIYIDVVLASDKKLGGGENIASYKTIQVLMRTNKLMSIEKANIALIRARQSFPNVNFRYLVRPTRGIGDPKIPMNFNRLQVRRLIGMGKSDAEDVVKKGEGVAYEEAIREAEKKYKIGGGYAKSYI